MVPATNPDAIFAVQLTGVLAIGAFVFSSSLLLWAALRVTVGIRLGVSCEEAGSGQTELGSRAYHLLEEHFGGQANSTVSGSRSQTRIHGKVSA